MGDIGVDHPELEGPQEISVTGVHASITAWMPGDDNADVADSLAAIVEMLGHAAEVCCNGRTAVSLAEAGLHDVVLCDIGLPDMSGYEVAQNLRRKLPAKTRLVAISGYAQPEDVQQALDAGFDAHFAKPIDTLRIEQILTGMDRPDH